MVNVFVHYLNLSRQKQMLDVWGFQLIYKQIKIMNYIVCQNSDLNIRDDFEPNQYTGKYTVNLY